MLSSTMKCNSVGRKCISLMTHIKQPRTLKSSLCFASHAVNKLLDQSHNYSTKGNSTYQQRQRFLQSKCVTSLMNFSQFPVGSSYGCQSSLFRTHLISRKVATNGNKQPEQNKDKESNISEPVKLSLLQRFKKMYRDYWYVLVPVHLITSLGWFAGFYYLAKSGVDVIALLHSMGVSERVINPLRDSAAGYIALAYALYKLATPVRYAVTLGGTTVLINYLKEWGYIKPIPNREKLKEMYHVKKATLNREKLKEMYHEKKATLIRETTEEIKLGQEKLKKTRENVLRGYRERAGKPEK